jgi:hypothetical protein
MDTDDDDDDDDDFDEDRMFLPAFLAAPMDTSTSSLISMKMGDACVIEDHLMSDSLVTLLLSATTKSAAQQWIAMKTVRTVKSSSGEKIKKLWAWQFCIGISVAFPMDLRGSYF